MNNMKFNIVENIGILRDGDYSVELNTVEWGNMRPKYDLRTWKLKGGKRVPCKGLTLDMDELRALKRILDGVEVLVDE